MFRVAEVVEEDTETGKSRKYTFKRLFNQIYSDRVHFWNLDHPSPLRGMNGLNVDSSVRFLQRFPNLCRKIAFDFQLTFIIHFNIIFCEEILIDLDAG